MPRTQSGNWREKTEVNWAHVLYGNELTEIHKAAEHDNNNNGPI